MRVNFTRTGDRGYGIRVKPRGFEGLEMNPAPGYDEHLPHDLVHFVVEEELGIALGLFGQLAAGGDAGTFRLASSQGGPRERARKQRRIKRRGARLARAGRGDAELSERAAGICHHLWLARSQMPEHRRQARLGAPDLERLRASCSAAENALLSDGSIERVCHRLDRLSERWSKLAVGDSLALTWGSEEDAHT